METRQKILRHKKQSRHYFENSLHFLQLNELEKAGEMMWGALTQALKAVAMSRNKLLRSHSDIREYALSFAKTADRDVYQAFVTAQWLHTNFYETGLATKEVALAATQIKAAVAKLLSHIPEEN